MKRKKSLKPWVVNLISAILILVIIYSGYNIFKISTEENKTIGIQNEFKLEDTLTTVDSEEKKETYAERFAHLKSINNDFYGWIVFDSGLIDLPFVRYTDNEYYLNRDINKEKSSHGTVFQDYLQTLDSKNITLYGHYVYNNAKLMFTPLATLTNKENYEVNKNFSLFLDNKVKRYEMVAIIKYNAADFPIYQESDITGEQFNQYKTYIDTHKLYDTGVEISETDNLISLQTCVRNDNDSRWVVVGKLVSEEAVQ
ncbi:MAG: class B sortase [Erysipelotrichaceae bacterium]|nr:class B sortase [Erysipelotrichaceae bacterium]